MSSIIGRNHGTVGLDLGKLLYILDNICMHVLGSRVIVRDFEFLMQQLTTYPPLARKNIKGRTLWILVREKNMSRSPSPASSLDYLGSDKSGNEEEYVPSSHRRTLTKRRAPGNKSGPVLKINLSALQPRSPHSSKPSSSSIAPSIGCAAAVALALAKT